MQPLTQAVQTMQRARVIPTVTSIKQQTMKTVTMTIGPRMQPATLVE
ncbi:MAG TPA: hypothetical protein VGS11_12535 [Candidatus Bathyarchaeia archaeon]|nr:hypothetical protein [Candidatus Bathyarchaeia archaeon]